MQRAYAYLLVIVGALAIFLMARVFASPPAAVRSTAAVALARDAGAPPSQGVPRSINATIYLLGYEGSTRSVSSVAPYITLAANPSIANQAAIHAAGIPLYTYTDFMVEYGCVTCSPMYADALSAAPSVIARDASGANVLYVSKLPPAYQMDPTVNKLFDLWYNDVTHGHVGHPDYCYADDVPGPAYADRTKPNDLSAWPAAEAAGVSSHIGDCHGIIYNGLGGGQGIDSTNALYVIDHTPVSPVGALEEDCYGYQAGSNDAPIPLARWQATENDEIAMYDRHDLWLCYPDSYGPGAAEQPLRTFIFASFMLTYDLAHSTMFERLYANATDKNNFIGPEYGLVATDPLVAEPSDISALGIGGAYGREYAHCYLRGVPVGPCASVVNPDSVAHPYPYGTKYAHSLVLTGGSVFDGGTAAFSSTAIPDTLDPQTAVIVAQ